MVNLFLKTLLSYLMILILIVNISYTIDIVQVINPTSLVRPEGYSEYYFGFSNILEGFQSMSSTSTILYSFNIFLQKFGQTIQYVYTAFSLPVNIPNRSLGDLISMVIALVLFTNSIIPMLMMIFYGICYIIYLLVFAFSIVLFVMRMMGGYYVTPLPSTDWWDYPPSEIIQSFKAIMV